METFKMKTYADSYLYNEFSKASGKSIDKSILDYIIKAHRLDKNEPSFSGVVEEIKRHQSSPVLISILFNENVVLCMGDTELPIAFKVFDAKDVKNNRKPKVFIDLTGRIEYKDGYYIIKRNEADKVCALLFDALIYLLYRNQITRLVNNNNIVLTASKCYVSMFNYIIDYLRIIGFSQNKTKISYLTALFFLHGMVGYDLDDKYTKDIAARIAGISAREAHAYDYYFEDDKSIFDNIGTFIPAIVSIFKLKGLDLSVFVNRWTNSFGLGTEYATELYTSFLVVLVNAYSGSYIIRQRQISAACGDSNLVKVANAIIHAGSDIYDIGRYAESTESHKFEVHSEHAQNMSDSLKLKNEIIANGIYIKKFNNPMLVNESANDIINKCKAAKIEDRISSYTEKSLLNGVEIAYESSWSMLHGEDTDYAPGTLTEAVKILAPYITKELAYNINKIIDRDTKHLSELLEEYYDLPDTIKSDVSVNILELKSLKSLF